MNTAPFFSILLPTKNRSDLLGAAIQSVLDQTFDDFEIIIADNDDDQRATYNVVKSFSDLRIKYIRTGGLSMVENWEAARKHATGHFITVLADKGSYFTNTLDSIHKAIKKYDAKIVSWRQHGYTRKINNKTVNIDTDDFKAYSASDIINAHLRRDLKPWIKSPRGLNSATSRDYINEILSKHQLSAFYQAYSPDITSAFLQLLTSDTIYVTNKKLGFIRSNISNGSLASIDPKLSEKYFSGNSKINIGDSVTNVPIKSTVIIWNIVQSDFIFILSQLNNDSRHLNIDNYMYAYRCFQDLYSKKHKTYNYKNELSKINDFVKTLNTKDRLKYDMLAFVYKIRKFYILLKKKKY